MLKKINKMKNKRFAVVLWALILLFGVIVGTQLASAINNGGNAGISGTDDTILPSEGSVARFAEDRVIVKMSNNPQPGTFSTFSSTSVFPANLGVSFTGIRMLNPSQGSGNTGGFTASSFTSSNAGSKNNIYVLTLEKTGDDAVKSALAILNANPAVEIAEPDFLYEISETPNDPMFDAQWALTNINAEKAWEITKGSRNVVVGIVDTGIDGKHPDLAANLWVNPNPNQNGYVDDLHGYNFSGMVGGTPTDEHGHGTHVAGIVGAKGNNGIGVSGINWDVSLAWMGTHAGGNSISLSAAIEAIYYANNHNIHVLNNSYGGDEYSEIFRQAIADYNGLFVAAAGNDYGDNDIRPQYPASYNLPNVISVASTDSSDFKSDFSNYGAKSVKIAAPGSGILSTYPGDAYREMSGTSMATPYVTGVAALIKAVDSGFTPAEIREMLIMSARPANAVERYNFGIVNAYDALRFAIGDVYSVTYNFLSNEIAPVTVKVVPGGRLSKLAEPSLDGYIFDGWYTEEYGGLLFDFSSDTVNGDMTLYARWIAAVSGMYAVEFPDVNFRNEVLRLLNDRDGGQRTRTSMISLSDKAMLAAFGRLEVSGGDIRDITGLKYFSGLSILDCSWNWLTELDLTDISGLVILNCSWNELTALDVTGNTRLDELDVSYNQMTSHDDVIGWRGIGLILDKNFIFYPQKRGFVNILRGIEEYGSSEEDMVINVNGPVALTSLLTIPGNPYGKTLTIRSDNADPTIISPIFGVQTITRRIGGDMITVNSGAKLILQNIVIDGNLGSYSNTGSIVRINGGELVMEDGAVLTNNSGYEGGGVYVNGGSFTMNGGEIRGNSTIPSATALYSHNGGGVYLNSGSFIMNGGKINENRGRYYGGGVNVNSGAFTLNSGEISGNSSSSGGGGVNGNLTMTGGKITGNSADNGAGVSGTVTMSGGEISGNSGTYGAGVYGGLIMSGGKITGNSAGYHGGGLYVSGGGAFTMTGGEISGDNSARQRGGGVYIDNAGISTIGGDAIISNNSARQDGGGVCVVNSSSLTVNGNAVISGNASGGSAWAGGGGGVSVTYNSALTVSGSAVISGNTAGGSTWANGGGGVSIDSVYGANNRLTVGGSAKILDNEGFNVNLRDGRYIALGTGVDEPAQGMEIGVSTETASKIIVKSGASAGDETYFFADEDGMKVVHENGQLRIRIDDKDVDKVVRIEISTLPTKLDYIAGQALNLSGMVVTAVLNDGREKIVTEYTTNPRVGSMLETGTQTITVNYGIGTTYFDVTVEPAASAYAEFQNRLTAYSASLEDMVINVREDILVTAGLTIPRNVEGKTLTITSGNGGGAFIRRFWGAMFTVSDGATLILKNIVIDGNKELYNATTQTTNTLVNINTRGTLIVNDGAVLTNNLVYNNGHVFIAADGGIFIMNGGEITGNTATGTAGSARVAHANSVFTMNGGKIHDNTGVYGVTVLAGTFNMNGGEISGNSQHGIRIQQSSTSRVTMTGGKISGNGGNGVNDESAGSNSFTMTGGEISENTGYGVLFGDYAAASSTFAMRGGIISKNALGGLSLGIGGYSNPVFNMSGGEISENGGHGVYLNNNTTIGVGNFTMSGGKIIGNTGNGIFSKVAAGIFIMTGGEVSGNIGRGLSGTGGNLGGKTVIRGNADGNVVLANNQYITLGTGDNAPAIGMNIGVSTATASGVIVNSGASAGDEAYFFADQSGKIVVHESGRLRIADAPVPQTESITITTQPAKTTYVVCDALDLSGMIVTATYEGGGTNAVTDYATNPGAGAVLNVIGRQTVMVSYEGKTAGFIITVNDTPDADGEYSYEADGINYSSFEELLLNIPDGEPVTVNLLKDVDSLLIIEGKTITFELNGYDLTGGIQAESGSVITLIGDVSGEIAAYGDETVVTVKGNAYGGAFAYENGTVNVEGDVYGYVEAGDYGTVNVEGDVHGITWVSSDDGEVYGNVMVYAGGTVTIGGSLYVEDENQFIKADGQWLDIYAGFDSIMKPDYTEFTIGGASAVWVAYVDMPSKPDLQIISFTLVSATRVTMTTYDYAFRANVINNGGAAENVSARLTGFPASVTVIGDANLTFGNIAEGATAVSNETFTIRRLMTAAYNDADLKFTFDYDNR